jgi:hypothetical protein
MRGKLVLAIMAGEYNQVILETLDILIHDEAVELLRLSIKEVKVGNQIPWQQAKVRLSV